MAGILTRDDVARLLSDPSPAVRAGTALKVAVHMDAGGLNAEERRIAEDILRAAARDASVVVREALSVNLKASRSLPRDVALALARDIDRVALPILEFSEVLSDADLIALVREATEEHQIAIARRRTVSAAVSDAVVGAGNRGAIRALVGNDGAQISESTLNNVVDRFGEDEGVQGAMTRRSSLPVAVAERLVVKLSDHLRDYLVTHHELTTDTASELILRARERATLDLAAGGETAVVIDLASRLAANGRLTPSLVLRAICVGEMGFFEAALAALARVPVDNARALIHDQGVLGLKSLYEKAGLPPHLLPTIRAAVDIARETSHSGGDYDRDSYSRMMIERILTRCTDLRPADADYLLRRLDDLAPGAVFA